MEMFGSLTKLFDASKNSCSWNQCCGMGKLSCHLKCWHIIPVPVQVWLVPYSWPGWECIQLLQGWGRKLQSMAWPFGVGGLVLFLSTRLPISLHPPTACLSNIQTKSMLLQSHSKKNYTLFLFSFLKSLFMTQFQITPLLNIPFKSSKI